MNEEQLKGNWKQFSGSVQKKWGELTDDDLHQIEGNRKKLVGKVQERYGKSKEAAEKEVDAYFESA